MPSLRRPVFLTGLMGSGKSTVGRLLAEQCGASFVDLDTRVERVFGESIPQVFSRSEAEFRRREAAALRSLLAEPAFAAQPVVVATGGGTVVAPANRTAMLQVGDVVFVDVDVDVLVLRLADVGQTDGRPLLAGDDQGPRASSIRGRLATLAAERARAYRDRALVVPGDRSPGEVVDRILAALDAAAQSGDTRPRHEAV